MAGCITADQGVRDERHPRYFAVKEAVPLPSSGRDPSSGPETKSTGEVMGTGATFGEAYAKASSRPASCCRWAVRRRACAIPTSRPP
jgi:carbamoyl-phosphate synthase large subunit